MVFTSYAQNLEDVILWRALSNFGPGFYIDVGACDPIADSVTKAFYEKGWRGINIEPIKDSFERIRIARPRDINLNLAIDAKKGTKTLYSIDSGNGLSTSIKEYADRYLSEGRKVEQIVVQTDTLAEICQTYVTQDIYFLKIDVEGAERFVLQGADFNKYRPWIILIESTEPNSTIQSHTNWEPILLSSGYVFVYFDGLNRFYLANEKVNLLGNFFSSPPNWFDNYERYKNISIAGEFESLKHTLDSLEAIKFPDFVTDESVFARINSLQANHALLSEQLAETKANLLTLKNENENFNHRNNELEKSLQTAEFKIQGLDAEIDVCYQEIYENSRHIGCLSKDRNNAHNRVQSLEDHVHHKEIAIQSLEDHVHHKEIAIQSLKDKVHHKEIAIQSLQDQITALLSSTSWRVFGPVRRVIGYIKRFGART